MYICRKEVPDIKGSREHVVPAALGGALIIREVCKDCNSKLGSNIDIGLTENKIIELYMNHYGLTKYGFPVNPFKNTDLYDINGVRVRMIIDEATGAFIPQRVTPNIEIKDIVGSNKKEIHAQCSPGQEDLCKEAIAKKLSRKFHADKNAIKANLKILEKRSTPYTNELSYVFEVDFNKLQMAVLKIAYELAYYWLGNEYLKSKFSKDISKILMENDFKNVTKYVKNVLSYKDSLIRHESYCISAFMITKPNTNDLYIIIGVFNIFSIIVKICNNIFINKIDKINSIPCILFDCKEKSYTDNTIINTIIGEMNIISNSSYLFDVNS